MRTQHCTRAPHATIPGRITHRIRNWSNYRTPNVGFRASSPAAVNAQGTPPDWAGQFDFSFTSLKSPLQVFARDALDVGNRAMVGVRRSDKPSAWLNMKALDVQASDAVVSDDGLTITYPGLWPGCDLVYTVGGHKLKETVVIWDKSIAPSKFEWTVKYAPSYTLDIVDDVLTLRDDDGGPQIETRRPWGEDSATTAPTASGKQYIGCALVEESSRRGLRVVCLTPNPDDMASAIGTVKLDPTTVISGTTALEDSFLSGRFDTNENRGGTSSFNITKDTNLNPRCVVARITQSQAASVIPAETITGWSYWSSFGTNFTSGTGCDMRIGYIKDGNDWFEGTADGIQQVGSCCFNYAKYNTQLWNGGALGCKVNGSDVDSTEEFVSVFGFSSTLLAVVANGNTTVMENWRDAVRESNGIRWAIAEGEGTYSSSLVYLTEEVTHPPPEWRIDHESLPASSYFFIGF